MAAGIAGTGAGAMSMAAGEYVSVSSQSDAEASDLDRERQELRAQPAAELQELAGIYRARGVEATLAREVAAQLMAKDALDAHAREELGLSQSTPCASCAGRVRVGGLIPGWRLVPLAVAWLVPGPGMTLAVTAVSLALLVLLGGIAARAGGASAAVGAARVGLWGALAMALTYGAGVLFDAMA